tara:strand:- start:288 stop:422 length:135 start_codon:yes stop_codon:yes gene_type:complete
MSRLDRHTEALLRIEIIINKKFSDDIFLLKDEIQREINIALQNE